MSLHREIVVEVVDLEDYDFLLKLFSALRAAGIMANYTGYEVEDEDDA